MGSFWYPRSGGVHSESFTLGNLSCLLNEFLVAGAWWIELAEGEHYLFCRIFSYKLGETFDHCVIIPGRGSDVNLKLASLLRNALLAAEPLFLHSGTDASDRALRRGLCLVHRLMLALERIAVLHLALPAGVLDWCKIFETDDVWHVMFRGSHFQAEVISAGII